MRLKLRFSDLNTRENSVNLKREEKNCSKPVVKSIYCNKDLIKKFSLNLKSVRNIFGYPLLVYSWSAKETFNTYVCHFGLCHMIFDRKAELESHLKTHLE